ncbi:MAG: hydantoinase/oxoprolinase family protein [Alphaproteobacteria bacterium]|nr:hydantoinase/oxoprolinase family protein [Alphaproteobacteria bacterium]
MRVGIEVGGTFTDLVVVRDGVVNVAKVPSTPRRPDEGAMNALDAAGLNPGSIAELVHGSTVATNAVLERKGGRVGVFVTRGTRDILVLQRHDRRAIYDLHYRKPEHVVARGDVCEIDERLAPDGSVVEAIDEQRLMATVESFLATGPFDSVAICLLHSYANPAHERRVADAVARLAPGLPVTCSSTVSPEFREYERASTTALAAYVQPAIASYLDRFSNSLRARGFSGRFSIMQSNGGRMPASAMADNAIAALFSGPAAGVVGAVGAASQSNYQDIITLDIGGTSTDVALVVGGRPERTPQTMIDGLPVRTPVIDIATVGAGGGSIVWIDDGGLLRVGPRSAGAVPGPACYGRGGTAPTITDAHLIRGTLQPQSFLDGKMQVDVAAAIEVFRTLANEAGMSVADLADSAIRIAENNIVRAIQQVSTERGRDPRDFALVPFGGAGPLHAARVATELGIRQVLVPMNAGVLSAVGLLMSEHVQYRSRTHRTRLTVEAIPSIREALTELYSEITAHLRDIGVKGAHRVEYILEMRYVGQAFELSVALDDDLDQLTFSGIFEAFRAAHHRIFEFSKPPEDPAEIVSYRVGVHVPAEAFPAGEVLPSGKAVGEEAPRSIEIVEGGVTLHCRVTRRAAISRTASDGPILIEDGTSTIYVPPGWQVLRDGVGNLVLAAKD